MATEELLANLNAWSEYAAFASRYHFVDQMLDRLGEYM